MLTTAAPSAVWHALRVVRTDAADFQIVVVCLEDGTLWNFGMSVRGLLELTIQKPCPRQLPSIACALLLAWLLESARSSAALGKTFDRHLRGSSTRLLTRGDSTRSLISDSVRFLPTKKTHTQKNFQSELRGPISSPNAQRREAS